MKHLVRATVMIAFVATSLVALPETPVEACVSAPAPFDSFTAAVPTAGTIVIGTVEGLAEREVHARFRLHIDEIVRGDAPAAMRFSGLSGSDALSACGDKNVVWARDGDRVALAMSAATPGEPLKVDAVAFVGDSKPDRRDMPKIEQLPLRQIRRLAGEAPDGSTTRRPDDAGNAADNLITERVAPGVARVSKRGTKHDVDEVRHLDVSTEDRVWAATRDTVFQLAQRKEYGDDEGLPGRIGSITTGPDGWAFIDGQGIWRFEEDRFWSELDKDIGRSMWWPLMMSDGAVLALRSRGVGRLVGDDLLIYDWKEVGAPDECVVVPTDANAIGCTTTRLVEAPDGSAWLGFSTFGWEWPFGGGLRRFDGEAWTEVPDPMDGEPFAVMNLAAYPGGDVWALLVPRRADDPGAGAYGRTQLARWDGETWTRHDVPSDLQAGRRSQPRELVAGPDGVVWLSRPLASFDGETWRRYDTPGRASSKKPRVQDLSIAPDGSAWMVVRDTVKFHTSRPDGIYILDPDRARPTQKTPASTDSEP